ncbi:TIGR02466 family protein [Bdellovibrio svalbardensis]|uniref:TIGR02466 family protein n=1 Tax=Bdellovibrio svalbardensis TaxID=2972972 RepID=A0ABT6DN84_9BACT|nr:TIGR02466 family protein [Bdellovibrio svalbardensis]MDG0816588.1 TIGR02466 family protein [Bdellovibrio svalbardensis]
MIKTLFPTFVYYAPLKAAGQKPTLSQMNKELKQEAKTYSRIDEEGQLWSLKNYPGGYTSYGSIAQLHQASTTFELLEKEINKHVRKFVKHLEMDIDPKELKMSSCWINIMPAGVHHSMHIHPLSVISGTYYVQTPKGSSAIKFEDPRMASFMATPPRKANAKEANQRFISLQPAEGHLVLFESWLRHEVPGNQFDKAAGGDTDKERISISFNYDWV